MASMTANSSSTSALAMIERELAALQEAKMMNAHALRTAVIEGQLRNAERVAALPPRPSAGGAGAPGLLLQGEARVAWEQAIIEDELSRPLEVPVEFVQDLAKREAQTEERLLKGLSKHQEALEGMKVRLLKREAEAEKTYAFKTAKEVLGPRPDTLEGYQASLLGSFEGSEMLKSGMISGAALDSASTSSKKSPSRRSQRSGESGHGGGGASSTSASNSTSGTAALTHFTLAEGRVLDSLARLEQLEQRIQDLEARTSGQDLAELLGITVPAAPGDGGTGSSAAALRSAYASVPLSGSASTKSPKKNAGGVAGAGGSSVFSTGSRVAAPGGVPKVGFAPVLGTVYTRKRVPSLNPSEPSRTVYLLERIEEATAKRGITLGPHGEFSMRFDNTESNLPHNIREPGDTGGSASGRNSATFRLTGLGDDDMMLDTDAMVANVPVETSDAIDRWLATKQRQVATTLQVRAAETVMKTSIVDSKKKSVVASTGKGVAGTGTAAVRAAQQEQLRGRQPTTTSANNPNQRLANSMGPVAGVRGRPLVKPAQTTGKLGGPSGSGSKPAASGDFHRRAARTVAVGSNISKVLQDERNRQAAKARLNRAPVSKSAAALKAEKASARNQTKRVALSQFDDLRKKFQTQKDNAGMPKLGTSTVLKSPVKSTLSHTRNINVAAKPGRAPKPTDPTTSGQKRPLLPRGQLTGPKPAPAPVKSAPVTKPTPHEAYTKKAVVKVIQQGGGEMKDSNTASSGPLKFGVMGPMQALKIEELKGFSQKKMEAAKAQLKPGTIASGKIGGPVSSRASMASPKVTTAGASVPLDIKSQLAASVSGKEERKSLFASTGGVRMDTLESLQLRKDEQRR